MENTKMQLVDWLDDLCVRFIINLPREELESVERICFQIEEAQWFYEDFIRPLDPSLPSLNLKAFSLRIFQHCPLFAQWTQDHYSVAFAEFLAYKTRVPVRGAIMLNEALDEVVLVKGWKKNANWSFPRGKINKDEKDLDCAIREVYEETGFDIQAAGLVPDESEVKSIEVSMREQHMRLFVFRGVPMDTHFEPRTRKEISKIDWYKLSELPTLKKSKQQGDGDNLAVNANKFYMVAPFLNPLKKWITQQKKYDTRRTPNAAQVTAPTALPEEVVTDNEPDELNNQFTVNKSHGNIQTPSDLPEVSISYPARDDPSSHLKQILNIGFGDPIRQSSNNGQADSSTKMDHTKSSALLALLKGPQSIPQLKSNIPETPLEQVSYPQDVPEPPQHQHPRPPAFSSLPPPPQFPLQPHASQPSASYFPPPSQQASQHGRYNQSGVHPGQPPSTHQGPAPHLQAAFPHGYNNSLPALNFASHGPVVSSTFQDSGTASPQPNQQPAPYQMTGDPQFARAPLFPGLHAPSIPPASNLPRLNNHTRSLLDVLKGRASSTAKVEATLPSPMHLPEHVDRVSPVGKTRRESSSGRVDLPDQPSLSQTQGLLGLLQPEQQRPQTLQKGKQRSQHEDNLLNLFRKPSIPATHVAPYSLLPSAAGAPVELSALPSPSLPADQRLPLQASVDRSRPTSNTVRATGTKQNGKKGHTAATVSGPLNLPQFEGMAKSTHNQQEIDGSGHIYSTQRYDQQQPRTILARPEAGPSASETVKRLAKPRVQPSPRQAPTKDAPKQFTILQRPTEQPPAVFTSPPSAASEHPPSPPMAQPLQKPLQRPLQPNFDRRESQPATQQQTLLSLFGKPPTKAADVDNAPISAISSPSAPAVSPPSAIISPMVDTMPQKIDTAVGLDSTRSSRLGSLSSMVGSGTQTPTSAKPTSASDKAFLNDFLSSATLGRRG